MATGTGFFVKFNTTIMDAINRLGATWQAQYASGIMSIMAGCITLYILWVGYSALAGKKQTPVDDLVWDLARFAMIIAFVTNAGGYLTATTEALQGLKAGFTGGTPVWSTLDQLWMSTQKLGDLVYSKDDSIYVKAEGGIGLLLIWGGAITLMLVSSVVFLTADLTMSFMLITAPIFIFCLMFGFLRPMFNNWLQLIFSSILTVLFASLVIRLAVDFQGDILAQIGSQVDDKNIVTMGAMGGVIGVLSALLVMIAAGFAAKLAGAGAEGAVQGLAMAGINTGTHLASKGIRPTARGLQAAGSLAAKSGAVGAINTTAKARAKAAVEAMKVVAANRYK